MDELDALLSFTGAGNSEELKNSHSSIGSVPFTEKGTLIKKLCRPFVHPSVRLFVCRVVCVPVYVSVRNAWLDIDLKLSGRLYRKKNVFR